MFTHDELLPSLDRMTLVGRRVLMVEDDILIALATIDVLESVGCVIVGPALRVKAALELVRSEPLDAAVLDMDIAGEMVWPVAEELQRRGVPFLFLSAYSRRDVAPVQFAAVVRLDKPVRKERLLNSIEAIL